MTPVGVQRSQLGMSARLRGHRARHLPYPIIGGLALARREYTVQLLDTGNGPLDGRRKA